MKTQKSEIMGRAWKIRRLAAEKFNCKISEINFSACLKMAWRGEIIMDELAKLKGSEKQIAWATTIRAKLLAGAEKFLADCQKRLEGRENNKQLQERAEKAALLVTNLKAEENAYCLINVRNWEAQDLICKASKNQVEFSVALIN